MKIDLRLFKRVRLYIECWAKPLASTLGGVSKNKGRQIRYGKNMNKLNYTCFKCGDRFLTDIVLETDKPTCNVCFQKLLKIKNVKSYFEFIE